MFRLLKYRVNTSIFINESCEFSPPPLFIVGTSSSSGRKFTIFNFILSHTRHVVDLLSIINNLRIIYRTRYIDNLTN